MENNTAEPQTGKPSAEKQEENIKSASKSGLITRIWEILSKIIRFPGNLWNKVISIIKGIIEKIKNITKTISEIHFQSAGSLHQKADSHESCSCEMERSYQALPELSR